MGQIDKTANLIIFQKRVKALMEENKYTISDLANYAGISLDSVKRYIEDTSSEPTIKIARSIAQALDTDLDYLFGLWDENNLFSRPQKADELLINLFKAVAVWYPSIGWYTDIYSKLVVITPENDYISTFFEKIDLDCDELGVRSIVSKFVSKIEESSMNPNELNKTKKKRKLDDVEEVSKLPSFGTRLNKFMIDENLTPSQLAEHTGIPYETVSSYFKKESNKPRINNAVKFAETFGIGLDFLLGINEDKYSANKYIVAKGAFINLYRMLQYANFKMQKNPESGDINATSSNPYIYYFFRRIDNLTTMDDLDLAAKEAEKFCQDYKLKVSETGEIMLYDEYVDSINSALFNQIRKINAFRAELEHKENG